MADFAGSCVRPDLDENNTLSLISSDKPADMSSPYAILPSVPEAAKNDNEEFNKIDQSHGEVLETPWKLISCGNQSSENACMEQEVSRYRTCNGVIALQGDKNDTCCTRSNNRCGIHEDLLFDIMLWLPVTSLLRFRSVCILWYSIIDSSTFITQHYNHNSNKSCLLAHHELSYSSYGADYDSEFCLLSGNKYEVYSNLDYKQPWYSVNEITILNSCNGIVSLFHEKSGNVALWNPATKQLRPLPESSIPRRLLSLCNGMSVKFGFGFDAKSNDYKVVKILYRCQHKDSSLVEVYNLRTDSWRTIHKDDVLPFQSIDRDGAIFKNGACFWTGYAHPDEFSLILISFDLNKEAFETMLLPGIDGPDHCIHAYNALDLLNEKLCYIMGVNSGPFDMDHTYDEIWMLDEYGVKKSWKKICRVKTNGSLVWNLYVLGFSKNGEFLLLGTTYGGGELYLSKFDAREEEYPELQSPKPLSNPNPFHSEFVCYNESLVSLEREHDGAHK